MIRGSAKRRDEGAGSYPVASDGLAFCSIYGVLAFVGDILLHRAASTIIRANIIFIVIVTLIFSLAAVFCVVVRICSLRVLISSTADVWRGCLARRNEDFHFRTSVSVSGKWTFPETEPRSPRQDEKTRRSSRGKETLFAERSYCGISRSLGGE